MDVWADLESYFRDRNAVLYAILLELSAQPDLPRKITKKPAQPLKDPYALSRILNSGNKNFYGGGGSGSGPNPFANTGGGGNG